MNYVLIAIGSCAFLYGIRYLLKVYQIGEENWPGDYGVPQNDPISEDTVNPTPEPETPRVEAISAPQTPSQTVYDIAVSLLAKQIYDDLDPTVPKEVGCVQSVCRVLQHAGYTMPRKGLYGVNALIDWMTTKGFKEIPAPQLGAIITAHRKDANDPAYAHVGVCGKNWIMSNDSSTGFFAANYTYGNWNRYFSVVHKCQVRYFLPAL